MVGDTPAIRSHVAAASGGAPGGGPKPDQAPDRLLAGKCRSTNRWLTTTPASIDCASSRRWRGHAAARRPSVRKYSAPTIDGHDLGLRSAARHAAGDGQRSQGTAAARDGAGDADRLDAVDASDVRLEAIVEGIARLRGWRRSVGGSVIEAVKSGPVSNWYCAARAAWLKRIPSTTEHASTNVNANSTARNVAIHQRRRVRVAVRPPPASPSPGLRLERCRAGASPKKRMLPNEVSSSTAMTRPSSRRSARNGTSAGTSEREGTKAEQREPEADHPARRRQDQALDQQLANQPSSARAEPRPDGELVRALGAAHQQQVGDVRAGDQEDQRADREERDPDQVRHAADHLLVDRHDGGAERRGAGWRLGVQLARDRAQLGLRRARGSLRPADARTPTTSGAARLRGPREPATPDGTQRSARAREPEARAHDADDHRRPPIERDRAAQNPGVALVAPSPRDDRSGSRPAARPAASSSALKARPRAGLTTEEREAVVRDRHGRDCVGRQRLLGQRRWRRGEGGHPSHASSTVPGDSGPPHATGRGRGPARRGFRRT